MLQPGGPRLSAVQPRWFALIVKPRHEKAVDGLLRTKGLEGFVPLYTARNQWADRYKNVELPLFPGYALTRFEPAHGSSVLSTPGVVGIVRIGRDYASIPDDEIAALRRCTSSGLKVEPWPHLGVGALVRLEHGPLAGLTGTVLQISKTMKLVVSLNLLSRSVTVEIDRDWVGPIRSGLPFRRVS